MLTEIISFADFTMIQPETKDLSTWEKIKISADIIFLAQF